LLSVSWPAETDPEQEFEPVNVPLNEDEVTVAVPVRVAVHAAHGSSNPPAGMVIENAAVVRDSVPDTDPRPCAPELSSVIVNVPLNELPDCVTSQVMLPGPEESVAVPDHVPARLIGDGWSMLPHAGVAASVATSNVTHPNPRSDRDV